MTKNDLFNLFKLNNILSSKTIMATIIAIIFHLVGLVGILVFKSELIINATPFNLLLSFALLIWTQELKNISFYIFATITFLVGYTVEVIGVNTGLLFGNYQYGSVLGPKVLNVPLLIGVNWFIIIFCAGTSLHLLLSKAIKKVANETKKPSKMLKALSLVTDGATLAVAFDWLMEPVAIKLQFWSWQNGDIPLFNYSCWFIISLLLLLLFHSLPFFKKNIFAVHLLLIQAMFFLILRTFL